MEISENLCNDVAELIRLRKKFYVLNSTAKGLPIDNSNVTRSEATKISSSRSMFFSQTLVNCYIISMIFSVEIRD